MQWSCRGERRLQQAVHLWGCAFCYRSSSTFDLGFILSSSKSLRNTYQKYRLRLGKIMTHINCFLNENVLYSNLAPRWKSFLAVGNLNWESKHKIWHKSERCPQSCKERLFWLFCFTRPIICYKSSLFVSLVYLARNTNIAYHFSLPTVYIACFYNCVIDHKGNSLPDTV